MKTTSRPLALALVLMAMTLFLTACSGGVKDKNVVGTWEEMGSGATWILQENGQMTMDASAGEYRDYTAEEGKLVIGKGDSAESYTYQYGIGDDDTEYLLLYDGDSGMLAKALMK